MKAYERLDQKSRWCQEVSARKASGKPCSPNDPQAVAWCALGAILACYIDTSTMLGMITRLKEYLRAKSIWEWNDSTDYENVRIVLLMLDI